MTHLAELGGLDQDGRFAPVLRVRFEPPGPEHGANPTAWYKAAMDMMVAEHASLTRRAYCAQGEDEQATIFVIAAPHAGEFLRITPKPQQLADAREFQRVGAWHFLPRGI